MNNKFISIFILISFCLNFLYATDNNSSNALSSQNQELAENISKMVDANLTQDNQNQELVNIIAQKIVDDNTTEESEDTLKNTLFEFVDELIGINKQIDILKWQNDQNSTEDEVQKLTNTKTDLLNKIPSAITNQKFPLSFIEKYIEEKKN
ncbi:mechanosensitive ion channel family protein [Campylobacter sputorum subsp. bubulus]|uniref:hypothetical protein n=1 Tax=Campylobacter sputorum TaxID=206 RepID=UPI000E11D586|nr:hypothetical protein [Campylobacter sputorum]SUX08386.1 mechanosensitive ion channel family protein [Campylobacter sputorum subsp. bubulus]